MLAPVVVFVYNRPDHTRQTIEALSRNYLANQTDIFIYSDEAKSTKEEVKVRQVRTYIDSLSEKKWFKSVKVNKANFNRGLANSVITGVSEIINKYGKAIVVEDDLVSTKDFLQYMNDALIYYENHEKIWSISGFNIPIKIPTNYKSDVYLSYRGASWGWATWKDRWEIVDWEVQDYNIFKYDTELREKLNRGGRDMADMLDAQMAGKIDSWAIRWCYTQSKLDMYTIYPVDSKIKNIGLDGTGTHSGISTKYETSFRNDIEQYSLEYPAVNNLILRRFRNHYMSLFGYYMITPKRVIKYIIRRISNVKNT